MSARLLAVIGVAAWAHGCGGSPPRAATTGAAAGTETVLVVDAPLSDAASELASSDSGIHVAPPDEAASSTARAREMVESARRRYVAIEFDEALATIRDAVVLLESEARTREDFDLLADALLVRGMAEMGLGRDEPARASLLAAARLRPERDLDEGRYPPQIRERYEALRAELRAEPASSLTVTTRPGGARLFFDGEPRGVAPDTLYATSGRHQLRVEAIGFAPRTLAVVLDPDGEQLEVELPPAEPLDAVAQLRGADEDAVSDAVAREHLARALGATRAVRARAAADGSIDVIAFDLSSGDVQRASGGSLEEAYRALPEPPAGGDVQGEPRASDGTARRHEGLYARLTLGTALRGDEHVVGEGDTNKAGAGTLTLEYELAIGGSLAPGVVLGGALLGLLGGPSLEFDMGRGAPTIAAPGALAIFLTWYPSATGGWHAQGLVGGARGDRTGGEGELADRAFVGGVLGIGGGYEWWIASEWGVGVMGRLSIYSLRASDDADVSWTMLAIGVAGTVTLN